MQWLKFVTKNFYLNSISSSLFQVQSIWPILNCLRKHCEATEIDIYVFSSTLVSQRCVKHNFEFKSKNNDNFSLRSLGFELLNAKSVGMFEQHYLKHLYFDTMIVYVKSIWPSLKSDFNFEVWCPDLIKNLWQLSIPTIYQTLNSILKPSHFASLKHRIFV